MDKSISIVCEYLSTIKSKLPAIPVGTDKYEFVDGDTLYIQFIKKDEFNGNEFEIIYVNLQSDSNLPTHLFLLYDNEIHKENDILVLKFKESFFERRTCLRTDSLDVKPGDFPEFTIKKDISPIPKINEQLTVNTHPERIQIVKAPKYESLIIIALMRIIGLTITLKVIKGMTLSKLLTLLRVATKLKIRNSDGSIDAASTFFYVAKSMNLQYLGAPIKASDIGEMTIEKGKIVSAEVVKTLNVEGLLDPVMAEKLNYASMKTKPFPLIRESLNKIFSDYEDYLYSLKKLANSSKLIGFPPYIAEAYQIVKEGIESAFTMLNDLNIALESLETNITLKNYVKRYFLSFITEMHLESGLEIFRNMVRDAVKYLKKTIDSGCENIYISSSEHLAESASTESYYVSPLTENMTKFSNIPLAESVIDQYGKKSIVFFADTTYAPNTILSDTLKHVSLHDIVETTVHEVMHVILDGRVLDFFYLFVEENGRLTSLANALQIFYNFTNQRQISPPVAQYIEELCQVNGLIFNTHNVEKIVRSSLFKVNVMLGNADCLALFVRDIAEFSSRIKWNTILNRRLQASLRP